VTWSEVEGQSDVDALVLPQSFSGALQPAELAGDPVGDGDRVAGRALAPSPGRGCLDEGVHAFEKCGGGTRLKDPQHPVPVSFDFPRHPLTGSSRLRIAQLYHFPRSLVASGRVTQDE
jgi:hypothetical protein